MIQFKTVQEIVEASAIINQTVEFFSQRLNEKLKELNNATMDEQGDAIAQEVSYLTARIKYESAQNDLLEKQYKKLRPMARFKDFLDGSKN